MWAAVFAFVRTWGLVLLLTAAGLALAYRFVAPAPPEVVRFATSSDPSGAYARAVDAYAEGLAAEGFRVERRPTAGSVENLDLLRRGAVDFALVQGGVVADRARDGAGLVSLGAAFFEPAWVFVRREPGAPVRVSRLRGRDVAVGPEGSGTRVLALALLEANGLGADAIRPSPLAGEAAAEALLSGAVEGAVFVAGVPTAPLVRLLRAAAEEGATVELLDFAARADAYASVLPYLTRVRLPRSSISLADDVPPEDVTLMAPAASVVAREDVHPQLVALLVRVMREAHSRRTLFAPEGRFPSPLGADLPLHQDAARFYERGVSFLQTYLPFWVAVTVERLWVLAIPLVTLLVPLARFAPSIYAWQMDRQLWKLYDKLRKLEAEGPRAPGAAERLAALDAEAAALKLPDSYGDRIYELRRHVAFAQERLRRATPVGGLGLVREAGVPGSSPV